MEVKDLKKMMHTDRRRTIEVTQGLETNLPIKTDIQLSSLEKELVVPEKVTYLVSSSIMT